jgi:hypothetical protein
MAIAYVTTTDAIVSDGSAGESRNLAFAANVTAGNILVVIACGYRAAAAFTFSTPIDNAAGGTNTYTINKSVISDSIESGDSMGVMITTAKAKGSEPITVTFGFSASIYNCVGVMEVSGCDPTTWYGGHGNTGDSVGSTGTAPTTTVTTTVDNALVIGVMGSGGSGHPPASWSLNTAGGTWPADVNWDNGDAGMLTGGSYVPKAAAGAQALAWTITSSYWRVAAIDLVPAAGGASAKTTRSNPLGVFSGMNFRGRI